MLPFSHTVVIGFSAVGKSIVDALEPISEAPIWIIDCEPGRLREAAKRGHISIYGDGRDPRVLRNSHAGLAVRIICCVSDDAMPAVIKTARDIVSEAHIEAVVHSSDARFAALDAGANNAISLAGLAGSLLADAALSIGRR